MSAALTLLLLVGIANGAPILARALLGARLARPLDGGWTLADGRALLGPSKTLRGVVAAVACTVPAAAIAGPGAGLGLQIALLAMLGDALSSFAKRRLGLAPSARAPLLDQIPEAALPLLAAWEPLGLDWRGGLLVLVLFTAGEMGLSPLLYRLRLRRRPY